MPSHRLWAFERGVLWAVDLDGPIAASAQPHSAVTFSEVAAPEAMTPLAGAMGVDAVSTVQRRLTAGSRCFVARIDGIAGIAGVESAIAGYGWVSRGAERIGELEGVLRMKPDEAYIWDCATLPHYRRQHIYTALLGHLLTTLRSEGVRRVWIGATLNNHPSLRGFIHAGFQPVITVVHMRALLVRHTWMVGQATAPLALIADARRALMGEWDTGERAEQFAPARRSDGASRQR